MNYKILLGNGSIESRPLTVSELDDGLAILEDIFEGRLYVNSITYEAGD